MQFHLSLNVTDVGQSVEFYTKVFGPPAKHRADYAKFELTDPPLVLSLEPTPPAGRGSLNHVGLRLPDAESLVELQRRLELAGLRSEREEGVECCYAKQSKFWLHSPDGVLWEFYVLQGDITHRGAGQAPEKVAGNGHASPPATSPASLTWEHRLDEPFPQSLPFDDGALSEVLLRGTFNRADADADRDSILAETKRVLAHGGRITLHVLTADRSMNAAPSLPGPAAVVKAVPTATALISMLQDAGFVGTRLTKFGSNPCFRIDGVEMRETMLEAYVPAAEADSSVLVVYRGPFREVTDDTGRVFRRGERVRLPVAVWEQLSSSLPAETFTRLAEPETTPLACTTG